MKKHLVIALIVTSVSASAQVPDSAARPPAALTATDAAVERARRLVNEGRGAEGRAVLDSLLRALPPGSPQIGSVLLGRAMTATTSEQAEADLRRLTVEFALTPPAETALVRLAQLAMQRGDRAAAFAHLQRLMVEYTTPGARARAAYWMGRLHRDGGDEAKACEAFGSARTWAPPVDVELANQVEYAARRCPAAPSSVASVPPQVTPAPATTTSGPVPAATTTSAPVPSAAPPTITVDKPTFSAPPPSVTRPDTSSMVQRRDTVARTGSSAAGATSGAGATPSTATATPGSTAAPAVRHFSVQIAAYTTLPDAERLAESYRRGGADARVDGTTAPFRVRVGRYATREEANKVAEDFRRRGQAAFVVVIDPR